MLKYLCVKPIFTSAIPETEGTVTFVEAAFRMEALWDGIQGVHEAWKQIADPEDQNPRVDGGWLLGVRQIHLHLPPTNEADSSFS